MRPTKPETLPDFIERCGSLAEAARRLDVPYETLWRWVQGRTKPSRLMRLWALETRRVDLLAMRFNREL